MYGGEYYETFTKTAAKADKTRAEFSRYKPGQAILFGAHTIEGSPPNYHHKINPRGTEALDFSTGLSLALHNNYDGFINYMETKKGTFNPRVTLVGASLVYGKFLFTDQVRGASLADDETKTGTGMGRTIGISPSVAFGASLGTTPIELDLYTTLQYINYYLTVTSEQNTEIVSTKGMMTGKSGFELRFPSLLTSNPALVRLERVGMGCSGTFSNQFAYFTTSFNYSGSEQHLIRTLLTPYHNLFVDRSEIGLEAQLLQIQYAAKWATITTSPGLRTEYLNAHKTTRVEAFNEIDFEIQKRYSVAFRAGWSGVVDGNKDEGAPSTPFGSLNFTLNTNQ